MDKTRYAALDSLRGLILISMMIYHAIWNVVYIFGERWLWYKSEAVYYWQQSICWGFILLSGFCWSFGRDKWKRGGVVLAAGALISAVTYWVMPENIIICGVLTCLGSCMLLMIPLNEWMKNRNPVWGMIVSFGLFLVTRNINKGSLGFGEWELAGLPEGWYTNLLTAYLGLPPAEFFSTDYFSLFPWLFLFMTGYFLHGIVKQKELLPYLNMPQVIPLTWMGRHSLFIYLLHQPIIYGILLICYTIF